MFVSSMRGAFLRLCLGGGVCLCLAVWLSIAYIDKRRSRGDVDAPALWGEHLSTTCGECGFPYQCDARSLESHEHIHFAQLWVYR
jgi:hypothetical protein